jgi:hypothetical protein
MRVQRDILMTMEHYFIFGLINTFFVFISLFGIFSQWQRIKHRQLKNEAHPCALLSQNQFSVSFLAYLSFFVYGYSISPFNHYLVWPRLIAAVIVLAILYEIWRDRQSLLATSCFIGAFILLSLANIGLCVGDSYTDESKFISTGLVLVVSLFLAQGYLHQILVIIRAGSTGAVELKMSQFILMMDISTIAFAFSMGIELGWPLLTLACTSAITKLIIMYLFRWVRVSKQAQQRRLKMVAEV